jgi:5-methylcytosine-specific restriction protein A
MSKGGYLLCDNSSWNELQVAIEQVINLMIASHSGVDSTNDIYDIESKEAEEGYEFDRIIKSRKRNLKIIEERKKLDKHTCQACGFNLKVDKKPIIECHHLEPLSFGLRLTKIEDLVCLCPTCHRIAHLRSKPYSVDEIKHIRNET